MDKDKKGKKGLKCYTKTAPLSGKVYTTCNADAQQEGSKKKPKKRRLVLKTRPKSVEGQRPPPPPPPPPAKKKVKRLVLKVRPKPVEKKELPDDVLKIISDYSKPTPREKQETFDWDNMTKANKTKLINRIARAPVLKAKFKELFDLKTKIVNMGGESKDKYGDDDDFDDKKGKRTMAEYKKTWARQATRSINRAKYSELPDNATITQFIKFFANDSSSLSTTNDIAAELRYYNKELSRLEQKAAETKKNAPIVAAQQAEMDKPLSLKYKFAFKFYGLYPKGVKGIDDDKIQDYLWKEYQRDPRYPRWVKMMKTDAKKIGYDMGKGHFMEMFFAAKRHIRDKDIEQYMTIEDALDYIFSEQTKQGMFMAHKALYTR